MAKLPNTTAEKLFQQLIDLMADLTGAYGAPEDDNDDDDGVEVMDEDDMIDMLVEEGAERGLDEEGTERVLKAAAALAKKSAES